MTNLSSILIIIISFAMSYNSFACWEAPPEFIIIETNTKNKFIRKINSKKVIEVRKSSDLKLDWKQKIDNYNALFSRIVLSLDGNKLVHILSNHMVKSESDICVEIFHRDGKKVSYKINEFMEKLPKNKDYNKSIDPTNVWLNKVILILDDYIRVETVNNKDVKMSTNKHHLDISNK